MRYLIGTDEAGYGPNLGPLVVSATVWQIDRDDADDLYEILSPAFSDDVRRVRSSLVIADSKRLYQPSGSLGPLETGLYGGLRLAQSSSEPSTWTEIWERLSPRAADVMASIPWYADFTCELPLAADRSLIESLVSAAAEQCRRQGVHLVNIASETVFARPFNQAVRQSQSKGALLSDTTLELIKRVLSTVPVAPTSIVCDKHGGRSRYAPLLQSHFGTALVQVQTEGRAESAYRFTDNGRPVQIAFRAGGESFLPSAMASMASKYLRELAMKAFNDFWQKRQPGLKPTAGYPVDARRFYHEISQLLRQLQIADDDLWRCR